MPSAAILTHRAFLLSLKQMKIELKLSTVLLLISLVLVGMGGLLDMSGQERIMGISRQHLWNDGTYLAVLAIAVHLILRI